MNENEDINKGIDEENESIETNANAESNPEEDEQQSDVYKWYAVRIIAGHENKVKTYLDAQIRDEGLEQKIKNVLIPLEKVFEVKSGKKKVKFKNI